MRCPSCGEARDKVIDSRAAEEGRAIRRRRQCLGCNRRFTTYERLEDALRLMVIKKDGSRVPYDRQKLFAGLEKACYKRPVSVQQLHQVVEDVERELMQTHDREVESREIGRLLSDRLKQVDQVAYVRFASVYKQFRDIEELLAEVKDMMDAGPTLDGSHQGRLF